MTDDSSWDAWEKLQRRKAEDEQLLREFAQHNSAKDVAEARKFVEHVRGDIGADGVITEVEVHRWSDGHKVIAGYYMEGPDPLPATVATHSNPVGSSMGGYGQAGASGGACLPAGVSPTVGVPTTGRQELQDMVAASESTCAVTLGEAEVYLPPEASMDRSAVAGWQSESSPG